MTFFSMKREESPMKSVHETTSYLCQRGCFKCDFSVGLAMGDLSLVSNLRRKSLILWLTLLLDDLSMYGLEKEPARSESVKSPYQRLQTDAFEGVDVEDQHW